MADYDWLVTWDRQAGTIEPEAAAAITNAMGSAGLAPFPIQRKALTANHTVDPSTWPTNQVVTAIYTQPASGGPYSVTYAGTPLPISPIGSTTIAWQHNGTAWMPLLERPKAARPLQDRLDAGTSCAMQLVGDSTGNETTEWFYLLGQRLAARYPGHSVIHRLWDDAAQDWAVPVTIQTGTAGAQYLDVVSGSSTHQLHPDLCPHLSGAIDVRVKARLDNWVTPAAVTVLASRGGVAAPNRVWWLQISTIGQLQFVYSVDGTNLVTVPATTSLTTAAGAIQWVRATFQPNDGAGNNVARFYTSPDGVTWTEVGTAKTATGVVALANVATGYEIGGRGSGTYGPHRIYEVEIRDGIGGKSVVPRYPAHWSSYGMSVAGAPILELLNCSVSGMGINYFTDTTRRGKMTPPAGQVLLALSLSHNEGYYYGRSYTQRLAVLAGDLLAALPPVGVLLCNQNPQLAPRDATRIEAHRRRATDVIALADAKDWAVADTYAAFTAIGPASLMQADGVHPAPAGSDVWMRTVAGILGI